MRTGPAGDRVGHLGQRQLGHALLHAQRDYAKQTAAAGIAAVEQVRHGMAQTAGAAPQS
jgi:hypothetical protein